MSSSRSNISKKAKTSSGMGQDVSVLESPNEQDLLLLQIGSMGWRAQHFDDKGVPISKLDSSSFLSFDVKGAERLYTVTRHFLEQLSKEEKETIGRIVVMLEGGSQFAFSDALGEKLATASKGSIREFGRHLLNQPDVTFGFNDQLRKEPGERAGAVYVFAGVDFLKEFLDTFQGLGLRISHVVPHEYVAMRRYYNLKEGAYATLHVGAFETSIILMNPVLGAQIARLIPIGILTLAKRLRDWKRLTDEQCLALLEKEGLQSLFEGKTEENTYISLLQEDLDLFIREIKKSLLFFEHHRICGRPDYLEIFGQTRRVKGFDQWIENQINVEVRTPSRLLIELFSDFLHDLRFNLLQGIAKKVCLLEVGNISYTFSSVGFASIKDIESGKLKLSDSEAWSIEDRHAARRVERKQIEQKNRKKMAQSVKFFALKLLGLEASRANKKSPEWMPWLFGLYGLCILILSVGYFNYLDLEKSYHHQVTAYLNQKSTMQDVRMEVDSIIQKNKSQQNELNNNTNTIIWSEKIFYLGTLMDDHLWLESLSFKSELTDPKSGAKKSGFMTIRVSMTPKKRNYLDEISGFMEQLKLKDSKFIKGFGMVNLKGVNEKTSNKKLVANFTVDIFGNTTSGK